ncbi:hypothetical protein GGS21DRAFT_489158 [Xylaria nigripes]|nr:hypothetical protein GGS21DRAFT_489158 [Xylaria nigripes]
MHNFSDPDQAPNSFKRSFFSQLLTIAMEISQSSTPKPALWAQRHQKRSATTMTARKKVDEYGGIEVWLTALGEVDRARQIHDRVHMSLFEPRPTSVVAQSIGPDVVIFAHSYEGIVASGAAKGLDKQTKISQGRATGVVGLIYVVGNIALKGESHSQAVGGSHPPFIKVNKPAEGLAVIEPAMSVLYNDCDPALEPEVAKQMNPHALMAFCYGIGAGSQ